MNFNKVCELEDFSDPELIEVMRDVFKHEIRHFTPDFPKGAEYRKYWEIAMSVRALRHFNALRPDASILGVGAGTEATLFYLTNHTQRVFATDLYLDPAGWGTYAPGFMLLEPEKVAPYEFDRKRLVVQHMNGCYLQYSDDSFDGIFSSGSIEHFGSPQDIANAAYEMGRVLKPGGVLTLSTEYLISGPPGSTGWPGVQLFTPSLIERYIVEASGLELVDTLDTSISAKTMESERDINFYIEENLTQTAQQGLYPRVGELVWSKYPHLVLVFNGHVFCSVHLTLRKNDYYDKTKNDWARPITPPPISPITILSGNAAVALPAPVPMLAAAPVLATSAQSGGNSAPQPSVPIVAVQPLAHAWMQVHSAIALWHMRRTEAMTMQGQIPVLGRLLQRLGRTRIIGTLLFMFKSVLRLGTIWDAQNRLYQAVELHQQLTTDVLNVLAQVAGDQTRGLDSINSTLSTLSTRLDHMERTSGLDQRQQIEQLQTRVNESLSNVQRRLDEQNATANSVEKRLLTVSSDLPKAMSQLQEANRLIAELVQRTQQQQDAINLGTSYNRLFRQKLLDGSKTATQPPHNLTGGDLIGIVRQLESQFPQLAKAQAVEFSVQDANLEEALTASWAYFGTRFSSNVKLTNDAWYHFDFTPDWQRPILFQNAAHKVVPGGWLVIVTSAQHIEPPDAGSLAKVADLNLSIRPETDVRVWIWQIP